MDTVSRKRVEPSFSSTLLLLLFLPDCSVAVAAVCVCVPGVEWNNSQDTRHLTPRSFLARCTTNFFSRPLLSPSFLSLNQFTTLRRDQLSTTET
jgi:hypothetical protein